MESSNRSSVQANQLTTRITESNGSEPPPVSIGLPVYNGEQYIKRTLDSLMAQTHADFELIICDNASTDNTAEIVRTYAEQDSRIRSYHNDRNMGATYNYNRCLELASGKYFKWIAADDVIRPEFLATTVDVLDAKPRVVLAYSKAAFIDENDRVIYPFDDVIKLQEWSSKPTARTSQMLKAIIQNGSAANVIIFGLVRTGALRSIRPLGNYFGPDYTVVTELALRGEIYQIPQVLSFYRRHTGSSSGYKRSPSAEEQQQFLDPSVTSRFQQEINLRRRYYEVFHSIVRADLSVRERVQIMSSATGSIARRAKWRLRYEWRARQGQPEEPAEIAADQGTGLHWLEFSQMTER